MCRRHYLYVPPLIILVDFKGAVFSPLEQITEQHGLAMRMMKSVLQAPPHLSVKYHPISEWYSVQV